jgi:hypothetical protein
LDSVTAGAADVVEEEVVAVADVAAGSSADWHPRRQEERPAARRKEKSERARGCRADLVGCGTVACGTAGQDAGKADLVGCGTRVPKRRETAFEASAAM